MSELGFLGIAEAGEQIRARKLSPVELTKALLERIDRLDPKYHAFIKVTPDIALQAAKDAEAEIGRGNVRGPLHGVPYGLKDIIDSAGRGLRLTVARYSVSIRSAVVISGNSTTAARVALFSNPVASETNWPFIIDRACKIVVCCSITESRVFSNMRINSSRGELFIIPCGLRLPNGSW